MPRVISAPWMLPSMCTAKVIEPFPPSTRNPIFAPALRSPPVAKLFVAFSKRWSVALPSIVAFRQSATMRTIMSHPAGFKQRSSKMLRDLDLPAHPYLRLSCNLAWSIGSRNGERNPAPSAEAVCSRKIYGTGKDGVGRGTTRLFPGTQRIPKSMTGIDWGILQTDDILSVGKTTNYLTKYRHSTPHLSPQIHPSEAPPRTWNRVATLAPAGLAYTYTRFRCT